MDRAFPLAAVLALRQQKELAEERVLAALGAEIAELRTSAARLEEELRNAGELRRSEVHSLRSAAGLQADDARRMALRTLGSELQAQLTALETRRQEQQQVFLLARRERETLSELELRYRTARQRQLDASEMKRVADLFGARHARRQ